MKIRTRVVIKDQEHPWHGHAGEVVGEDFLPVIRKTKICVRLDEGHECYVNQGKYRESAKGEIVKTLLEDGV